MPKYDCYISIGLVVDAPTAEAAMQELDNSVDLSKIRSRGHDVRDYSNSINVKREQEVGKE